MSHTKGTNGNTPGPSVPVPPTVPVPPRYTGPIPDGAPHPDSDPVGTPSR